MIISIIEGEPFAPSEKEEEGIWDQRETSHPSCAVLWITAVGAVLLYVGMDKEWI